MIGDPAVTAAILAGKSLGDIEALFAPDLDAFRAKRAKYLLYPR
jgi:2C-methyl-D-erythritol 2,4-cyclodiphosphate synthase